MVALYPFWKTVVKENPISHVSPLSFLSTQKRVKFTRSSGLENSARETEPQNWAGKISNTECEGLLVRKFLQGLQKGGFMQISRFMNFTWNRLYKELCLWSSAPIVQTEGISAFLLVQSCAFSTWQRTLYRRDSRSLTCLHSAQRSWSGVSGHPGQTHKPCAD